MSRIWAGTYCGKTHHHTLVMDAEGNALLTRRVASDEPELLQLIADVLDIAEGRAVTWAMDMTGGELGIGDGRRGSRARRPQGLHAALAPGPAPTFRRPHAHLRTFEITAVVSPAANLAPA